ncbi:MAG: cysteine--tRNA ligase [Chloroflexi bacterium]|nr:MAG: cysteine--tRNA ligase [Chloroflexota bacterium]
MRLYDTARRAVVPFQPRDNRVGMYVCGITPYDAAHMGHAFAYHVFDVIARRLILLDVDVHHVRNITDVDDDILRVARERNADYRTVGDAQVQRFDRDMADIGLLPVDAAPRATMHVAEMVRWIARLHEEGYAYEQAGWVFFDTAKFPRYGRLSGLDVATMTALSRERGADPDDPRKHNPLDFVLWQQSAAGEPSWPSPWSDGRPGWHIECSVLSTGELGHPIDLHGGGDDLIYPHHDSEIAQAEAIGVAPYVTHWVHVAMVRHQGEKMSKSLRNLVFVRDVLERVPGPTVRILLAAHHYRESWTYDEDELREADERRQRYHVAMQSDATLDSDDAQDYERQFLERLDDDLDTPGALRIIDLAAAALTHGAVRSRGGPVKAEEVLGRLLDTIGARAARRSESVGPAA